MKSTIAAIVAGAALAGVAHSASAQTASAPTYKNEVSAFGSWENIREPNKFEQSTIFLRYGRYVTPQLLGTAGLQRSHFDGSGLDATSTSLTAGVKYYFTAPRSQGIAPFVDADAGIAKTDNGTSDSTDFTWEIGGGVAWFLTEATSFDAGLRLFHTNTDATTKGTRAFVGITTRF